MASLVCEDISCMVSGAPLAASVEEPCQHWRGCPPQGHDSKYKINERTLSWLNSLLGNAFFLCAAVAPAALQGRP